MAPAGLCSWFPGQQGMMRSSPTDPVRQLRLIGGSPLPVKVRASAASPLRPARVSRVFKYYPPGKLLKGTGDDGMDGLADRNVYGDIRFPIKTAPSYAQSQVFMHWGK